MKEGVLKSKEEKVEGFNQKALNLTNSYSTDMRNFITIAFLTSLETNKNT